LKIKPILAIAGLAAALVGSARADTYAFLMGINDYPQPVDSSGNPLKNDKGEVIDSDLKGCVNDVNAMKGILMSKYGLPEGNIKLATDAAANQQGFIDGMKWLISSAKAGDQLLFQYSGHGGQIKGEKTAEDPDGLDEVIVLADDKLVPDDLFSSIAKSLAGKGVHVTFIFDSCHSGGMSRDAGGEIRKDKTARLSSRAVEVPKAQVVGLQDQARGLVTGTGQEKGSYAFLFAAKEDQTSSDVSFKDNSKPAHGIFTFVLSKALEIQSDAGLDPLEAVIVKLLADAKYTQVPNFEYSSADRANKPLIWK
jgi:hypothetical protein